MKMCDIIKELRAVQKYGDKSEQTMAKRMLNNLYGEQIKKEVTRITLLQYLNTFDCSYNGVYICIKDIWRGIPCLLDLGHFNLVKDNTLFSSAKLVKDDDITFAPSELYDLYIYNAERNPMTMTHNITLTSQWYIDTDSVKGETHGNND